MNFPLTWGEKTLPAGPCDTPILKTWKMLLVSYSFPQCSMLIPPRWSDLPTPGIGR